jgi:tubulin polyglutamylase TTLL6/13
MLAKGSWIYPLSRDLLELEPKKTDPSSKSPPLLLWYDTLRDRPGEFYTDLRAGQFVNRIPNTMLLCRKTTFARLISRMAGSGQPWAKYFDFIPQTFLFPAESAAFNEMIEQARGPLPRFIVKPEFGALGARIQILPAGTRCDCAEYAVVQAYLEPRLATVKGPVPEGRKFDFRIYALILSGNPPRVYVYREGLTRICAEAYGSDSSFAQLTNTAVNKKAQIPIQELTKWLRDTLDQIYPQRAARGVIWKKIKNAILLSVIAAAPYLDHRPDQAKPEVWDNSRRFQILGFDVMVDHQDRPYILEVNYRPSLSRDTDWETRIKKELLVDALSIVMENRPRGPDFADSSAKWDNFLIKHGRPENAFEEVALTSEFKKILDQNVQKGPIWEASGEYGSNMPGKWIAKTS